jgi:hypothetical protein
VRRPGRWVARGSIRVVCAGDSGGTATCRTPNHQTHNHPPNPPSCSHTCGRELDKRVLVCVCVCNDGKDAEWRKVRGPARWVASGSIRVVCARDSGGTATCRTPNHQTHNPYHQSSLRELDKA